MCNRLSFFCQAQIKSSLNFCLDCVRTSTWCTQDGSVYRDIDCDLDGIKDCLCTDNKKNIWTRLSSKKFEQHNPGWAYCEALDGRWWSFLCQSTTDHFFHKFIIGCRDYDDSCSSWATTGECEINPNYMLHMCKKSCKKCSSGDVCTCIRNSSLQNTVLTRYTYSFIMQDLIVIVLGWKYPHFLWLSWFRYQQYQ